MYPWIGRTLEFWLQFCEKKCGLYMDVCGIPPINKNLFNLENENRFLFFKIILVKYNCKAMQEFCSEKWELGIAVQIKVLIYWCNKKIKSKRLILLYRVLKYCTSIIHSNKSAYYAVWATVVSEQYKKDPSFDLRSSLSVNLKVFVTVKAS